MYKAKAVLNRGFKMPTLTVKCPVCKHDSTVLDDRHVMTTCRCGAVIEIDHTPSSAIAVVSPEPLPEPEIEMEAAPGDASEEAN